MLAAVVAAAGALRRGSATATGLWLAVATDSKPWVLGCGVLLMALPAGRRTRGLLTFGGGVAVAWLPFVLADPRTMRLGHFTIPNVASSALNALGVHDAVTPSWDRGAQLILGVAVAALAVWRGRWPAVLLAVVCARLLLDPETYKYYTSGLLVATALVDIYVRKRGFPMWTAAAALFYVVEDLLDPSLPAHLLGAVRAAYCITVLAVLALPGPQANVTDALVGSVRRHRRPWLGYLSPAVTNKHTAHDVGGSGSEASELAEWDAFLARLEGARLHQLASRSSSLANTGESPSAKAPHRRC